MIPSSIREINNLPEIEKRRVYSMLIPDWVFSQFGINPETYSVAGREVIRFRCPQGSRGCEITIKRHAMDADPLLYLHMADTFNNQLLVLLVVVNDPTAPRFNTDIDQEGNRTLLGSQGRNKAAELAAMQAGLAPGQVRRGLRVFRNLVPIFEAFIQKMGHEIFFIEPSAYHNAIVFERYGFNYVTGLKEMKRIHQAFLPDGELYQKLTPENPFRHPGIWKSVRGRSWAIHDGILGYPFTGFQMYKRVGQFAQICTFPNSEW